MVVDGVLGGGEAIKIKKKKKKLTSWFPEQVF